MKNKFRNLFCLLILVAAGTNLGIAQDEITVLKSRYPHPQQFQSVSNIDFDISQYQKMEDENGNEYYVKNVLLAKNKQNNVDAETDNAKVTLVFNMPSNSVRLRSIIMYSQDESFWFDTWGMSGNTIVKELPQGIYQLLVELSMNPEAPMSNGCSLGFIAKEDITINQDSTININFDDLKNVIYQEKKLPNGEAFTDANYDERVGGYVNQGNVISSMAILHLIDKDLGSMYQLTLVYPESYYIDKDGVSHDQRLRLFVSDMSDRYSLVLDHIAFGIDEELNSFYTVHSVKTGISDSENLLCNGYYKTVQAVVKPSKLSENSTWHGPYANILFLDENTGKCNYGYASYNAGVIREQYNMYVCENGDASPVNYKTLYNTTLAEYFDETIHSPRAIHVPWGDVSGEELVFQEITPVRNFSYNVKPNGEIYVTPNSTFSFKESEITDFFGNNTPINVFGNNYENMGIKIHMPECNFIGRMGEIRETDNSGLFFSLLYNGEEVCNDYWQCMNEWIWDWIYDSEHDDGAYDATIINQNMTVDDMQGCNTTKVHYDTRNEDFTPPTAMMLQFRNVDDNSVTDRFEYGENGMMYLAAKDYHVSLNEMGQGCMECLPVNVKASYAPNGTEKWIELAIHEMPDLFNEYSFGYIYAANLGQVRGNSDNKWYDLKIVLSDEAGNWQEQVISPAFRIEDGFTSINEVETDSKAVAVARYTIDGRRIATPQVGVNIVKYSDGSARKVIVK